MLARNTLSAIFTLGAAFLTIYAFVAPFVPELTRLTLGSGKHRLTEICARRHTEETRM